MAASRQPEAIDRVCGPCSLCCTVLRVDELAKLGGRACLHQQPEGGCRVHSRRPEVCRAYHCAWLGGAFRLEDRPDRLGAVLDLVSRGGMVHLVVRQARPDALERSPRLRDLVDAARMSMPVEIRDVESVLDGDRPYRILLPDDEEHHVEGEVVRSFRSGELVSEQRAPWLERGVRRVVERMRARRLRRWPSHESRLARLGVPVDSEWLRAAVRDREEPAHGSREGGREGGRDGGRVRPARQPEETDPE